MPITIAKARMARRSFLYDHDQEGVDYQEGNRNALTTLDSSILTDPSDEEPDLVAVVEVEAEGEIERRSH